jgi:hypothetical protein
MNPPFIIIGKRPNGETLFYCGNGFTPSAYSIAIRYDSKAEANARALTLSQLYVGLKVSVESGPVI